MYTKEDNRISVVIQDVQFFQDEMDTSAELRAFNNIVMLDSESIKLDDRRIDTQIRRNGWANILVQLRNDSENDSVTEEKENADIEETDAFPPEED